MTGREENSDAPQAFASKSSYRDTLDDFCAALHETFAIHSRGWPNDDGYLNEAESLRQTFRLAGGGFVSFLESDPAYPELVKMMTLGRQFQLPSPDAVYHYCRLDGKYDYRIRGNRGSAKIFQMTVWNGSCSNLQDYRMIDKVDWLSNSELAPGSDIDFVLSASDQPGPSMKLPDGPCEIFVRQYYGDWDTEEPARLTIERVGAVYPPPPLQPGQVEDRLKMVSVWLRTQSAFYKNAVQGHLDADQDELRPVLIPEAFQETVYLNGHYRCAEDEAIILSVEPPAGQFWAFQLANLQYEAMEYHMRQSSLNCEQAHVLPDGSLQIVISHRDPGIHNWLDTSGRSVGLLSGRYFKCETAPAPKLKKVPLGELEEHLSSDLPRITAEERQTSLRNRQASAFRRLCGDQ